MDAHMVHSEQAFSAGFSNGFVISEFPMCELCSVNSVLVHRGCLKKKKKKPQRNKPEKRKPSQG